VKGLTLSICDRALPPGGAPEWVHLLPAGAMTARDGRAFDLTNPGAVILAFEQGGINLPIGYEHQNDKPEAKLPGPVRAAGWISRLPKPQAAFGAVLSQNGVEWTATVREMISRPNTAFCRPRSCTTRRARSCA